MLEETQPKFVDLQQFLENPKILLSQLLKKQKCILKKHI
jgi:hypothetical protein